MHYFDMLEYGLFAECFVESEFFRQMMLLIYAVKNKQTKNQNFAPGIFTSCVRTLT